VGGGGQQLVHYFLIGFGRIVGQEGIHQFQIGRQPGQVHRHPAQQVFLVGRLVGLQSGPFHPLQDKVVDLILGPVLVFHLGQLGFFRRQEGPVVFVFGALSDPFFDQADLVLGEFEVGGGRRHDQVGVVGG